MSRVSLAIDIINSSTSLLLNIIREGRSSIVREAVKFLRELLSSEYEGEVTFDDLLMAIGEKGVGPVEESLAEAINSYLPEEVTLLAGTHIMSVPGERGNKIYTTITLFYNPSISRDQWVEVGLGTMETPSLLLVQTTEEEQREKSRGEKRREILEPQYLERIVREALTRLERLLEGAVHPKPEQ